MRTLNQTETKVSLTRYRRTLGRLEITKYQEKTKETKTSKTLHSNYNSKIQEIGIIKETHRNQNSA